MYHLKALHVFFFTYTAMQYKPQTEYFEHLADMIVRRSKIKPDKISLVQINLSNGGCLGWVCLVDGGKISVY